MKQEDAALLYEVYDRALKVLTEAETTLWDLPKDTEQTEMVRSHTEVIANILVNLRAPLVRQYPDLDTEVAEGPPDTELKPSDQEAISRLTSLQIQQINSALRADCAPTWRKVARVVGTTALKLSNEFPDLPDGYYARRIASLVNEGQLESQGNLDYMRYSEIRLPFN